MRAALVASCFRGALPPVDFRAVCGDERGGVEKGSVNGWHDNDDGVEGAGDDGDDDDDRATVSATVSRLAHLLGSGHLDC